MTAVQQRTVAPGRGQRREPRRSAGKALISAVVGLVLAAGAVGLQSIALTGDDMDQPLTYSGAKGQEVNAGRFSVKVTKVSSAKQVRAPSATTSTDLLFIAVELQATVPKEPLKLAMPDLLTDDGRRFAATDKVAKLKTLAEIPIQPGWWTSGVFVFEVPADALRGSRMEITPSTSALYSEPLLPEAQVDLGIDDATAKQLASAPAEAYVLGRENARQ